MPTVRSPLASIPRATPSASPPSRPSTVSSPTTTLSSFTTPPRLLDHTSAWWAHITDSTLDCFDIISYAAFKTIGLLFQVFETKRMSRLTRDKLIDCENFLALSSKWVVTAIDLVWKKHKALVARSLLLVESFCAIVFPLVYTTKTVAFDAIDVFRKPFRLGGSNNNVAVDS